MVVILLLLSRAQARLALTSEANTDRAKRRLALGKPPVNRRQAVR
jgi:hypothetical protein